MSASQSLKSVSRRGFLRRATLAAVAAASSGAWPSIVRSQEKDEIVIGFQNDVTGLLSPYGYWYDKTAKAVVARINGQGGIAGKKVRLVGEDTESNVNLGVRKLRKLIEEDKADVVLGSLHSGIAIQSAPIAQQLKTVYIPTANAQSITGKHGNRWVFRTITNAEMIAQATVSPDLVKEYGKRWSILYADYAWGQSHFEAWTPRLKNVGIEVTSALPVPLQTSDFFPHLAKLDRSSTAMLAVFFASDIIGLLKQRRELGITVPVMGVTGVTAGVAPDVLKDAAGTLVPESLPRNLKDKDTPAIREIRKAIGVDETGKEIGTSRYLSDSLLLGHVGERLHVQAGYRGEQVEDEGRQRPAHPRPREHEDGGGDGVPAGAQGDAPPGSSGLPRLLPDPHQRQGRHRHGAEDRPQGLGVSREPLRHGLHERAGVTAGDVAAPANPRRSGADGGAVLARGPLGPAPLRLRPLRDIA